MYSKKICMCQCCETSSNYIPWKYFYTEIFLFSTIMLILIVKKIKLDQKNQKFPNKQTTGKTCKINC